MSHDPVIMGGAGAVLQATPDTPTTEPESGTAGFTLVHFDRARHALEMAAGIDEVKTIRDQAEALRQYARQSRQSLEMQNKCAEIKLRAERKAGEMLARTERSAGGYAPSAAASVAGASPYRDAIQSIDLPERTAQRWQSVAAIPEPVFERHIETVKASGEELTTASLLRAADKPHVSHNSGENEWYTPREFIESARAVLLGFDLDPASSARANEVVQAKAFYSIEDDGLSQAWVGRVWMNPPYAAGLIEQFCSKLVTHYADGDIESAIVLVNNATETKWFQLMARVAEAICFPEKRVRFWSPDGEPGAPLQGQAFLYFGPNPGDFEAEFRQHGFVTEVVHA